MFTDEDDKTINPSLTYKKVSKLSYYFPIKFHLLYFGMIWSPYANKK